MAKTLLLYGESGTYKSSNVGIFADYQVARMNVINQRETHVRLLTTDSGVEPMRDQLKRGTIKYWNLKSADIRYTFAFLFLVAKGFWPSEIDSNGVADPLSMRMTKPEEWGSIAGYGFEGLTQNANLIMQHLTENRINTGEPLQALVDQFYQTASGENVGISLALGSRGSYNMIQTKSLEYVKAASALPVDRVIFTAHEGKGEDNQKRAILGPTTAGKAGNDKICGWFENTLHHESYMFATKRKVEISKGKFQDIEIVEPGVRAFFIRHPDPELNNIFWPAKLGVTPQCTGHLRKLYPYGFIPLTLDQNGEPDSGIHSFLSAIDEFQGRQ